LTNAACQKVHWAQHKADCAAVGRADAIIARARTLPCKDAADSLLKEGRELRAQARALAALRVFEEGLAVAEREHGEMHSQVSLFLTQVGNALNMLDRFPEALAAYERSHAIALQLGGPNHPELAPCLANMAVAHRKMGNTRAAVPLQLEVIRLRKGDANADLNTLAASCVNLGQTYGVLNQADEALSCLHEAVAIYRANPNVDKDGLSRALFGIGLAQGEAKLFDDALATYQEVLAIQKTVYGAAHPAVANTMHTMAATMRAQGRAAEASAMGKQAVRALEQSMGADDPGTVRLRAVWG